MNISLCVNPHLIRLFCNNMTATPPEVSVDFDQDVDELMDIHVEAITLPLPVQREIFRDDDDDEIRVADFQEEHIPPPFPVVIDDHVADEIIDVDSDENEVEVDSDDVSEFLSDSGYCTSLDSDEEDEDDGDRRSPDDDMRPNEEEHDGNRRRPSDDLGRNEDGNDENTPHETFAPSNQITNAEEPQPSRSSLSNCNNRAREDSNKEPAKRGRWATDSDSD